MSTTTTTQPDANSNGVHPSAIGSNTKPSDTSSQNDLNGKPENSSTEPDGGYPEQLHAGAVGYGPEYGRGAGFSEKITGLKEEAKGKITHNQDLVQQGKERRTGQLKKKQQEEEDKNSDPFANAGGDKKDDKKDDTKDNTKGDTKDPQSHTEAPESDNATSQTKGDKFTDEETTHPSQTTTADERGEKEQAATVAPEGTQTAESQRKGEAVEDVKNI